jgi:hypothetical protein
VPSRRLRTWWTGAVVRRRLREVDVSGEYEVIGLRGEFSGRRARDRVDEQVLQALIRTKLQDGRLPKISAPRVWGGSGRGETCAACETTITSDELAVEGVAPDRSISVILHVTCFHVWNREALAPE